MTPEPIPNPDDSVREAILATLVAHNESQIGPADRTNIAFVVRDDDGAIAGGLWGTASYRWLFVQYLAIPPAMQGQGVGRALMLAGEAEARRLGCIGIWLDTFSFQARGFYEKLGYAVFGEIDGFPPSHSRFFLQKRID